MVMISTAAGALLALVASAGSPLAWQGAAHSWVEADEALQVAVGRIALITVTSLGEEMVAAVAAATEAGGSDVAREAFACARDAAASASPTSEVATERTEFYGTFSGYDLPLRMSAPISPEEARSRRAYYVARRDESGRLREVRKVLDGATSFVHEYTYDAKGRLVEARVTNSEGEVRIVKPNRANKGS